MSVNKPANVTASVNTGMSVGGSQRPGKLRVHAKLLGVIFCVVVVLAAVAWFILWRHSSSPSAISAKGSVSAPPAGTDAEQKAQYYADEGQYKLAEQSWQDQLAGAKTNDDKVAVYYQQTAVAIQFKQYKDAQKYADTAKKLEPGSPTPYAALAQLAQAKHNIPQAKQYWQQAISHINKNMPGWNMVQGDYQRQLDALK